MGIKSQNFKENSSTTVTARYTSVLNLNTDSQFRKRPRDESGQFQPKRNKQQPALQDDDAPIESDGWHVNALVTLEYLPATNTSTSQTRVHSPSRDSGFPEPLHASSDSPRKHCRLLLPLTAAVLTATFCSHARCCCPLVGYSLSLVNPLRCKDPVLTVTLTLNYTRTGCFRCC